MLRTRHCWVSSQDPPAGRGAGPVAAGRGSVAGRGELSARLRTKKTVRDRDFQILHGRAGQRETRHVQTNMAATQQQQNGDSRALAQTGDSPRSKKKKTKEKNSNTNRLRRKKRGLQPVRFSMNTAPMLAVHPPTAGSPPTGGCKTRRPASRPSPPRASYPPARGSAAETAAQSPWPRRRARPPLGVGG